MKKFLTFFFCLLYLNLILSLRASNLMSFEQFANIVETRLPKNREIKPGNLDWCSFGNLEFLKELDNALDNFFDISKSELSIKSSWLQSFPEDIDKILDLNKQDYFKPFVEKKILSDKDSVVFRGDLHGDIHSLVSFLKSLQDISILEKNSFKIKDSNKHIIFLGDYTDRGLYGTEVLYVILRLKIANPNKVTLVRGNHEELELNKRYGFLFEFDNKFKKVSSEYKKLCCRKIIKFYNLLPVALYLGSGAKHKDFILCCHGGLEIGFNAKKIINSKDQIKYQFINKLDRYSQARKLKDYYILDQKKTVNLKSICRNFIPESSMDLGFLWSDFVVNPLELSNYSLHRGFAFNKDLSESIINLSNSSKNKLQGIIRAHQHSCSDKDHLMQLMLNNYGVAPLWNDPSPGKIFNLWPGIVCTFLLSPDNNRCRANSKFKGFNFDTWGILKLAPKFKNWSLSIFNNYIF